MRTLPSGRIQVAYTGPDGGLYKAPTTFEDKDAAGGWLTTERRLIDAGEWVPPAERGVKRKRKATTVTDFADTWLAGRDLKPRTRSHYKSIIEKQISPTIGNRLISGLQPEDIDQWYAQLDPKHPTLRAHTYGLLRTILASAVEKGYCTANPCHIRGAGNTKRAHKIEPLTLAELETLTAAMPEKYQLMILLAAWCAMRFGELAELRRKDVDLTNGRVKIRRGVVRAAGEVIVGTPKSDAGIRDVAIPPHLLPAIKQHLKDHAEPGREGLVFPAAGGGNLAPSTFYGKSPVKVSGEWRGGTNFYRARALAGRPKLHFHDLRHTGAVLAAQTGATLAELMNRLGHSTPGAAMRYQHAAADRDAQIAKRLSEMV
ncbi:MULTISPECIES: tyrosine-type recombinase/integrase [unclassified Luteococcus]|uniref:tyrosine-type recombinase/integrase n=1 Tax=unclassified Luteococcus TaxID=2639923 RepID=UPI00313BAEB2